MLETNNNSDLRSRLKAIDSLKNKNQKLQSHLLEIIKPIQGRIQYINSLISSLDESTMSKSKSSVEFYKCNLPVIRQSKFLTFFKELKYKQVEFDKKNFDEESDCLSYDNIDVQSTFDPYEFEWKLEPHASIETPLQSKRATNDNQEGKENSKISTWEISKFHKNKHSNSKLTVKSQKIRKRTRKVQGNAYWSKKRKTDEEKNSKHAFQEEKEKYSLEDFQISQKMKNSFTNSITSGFKRSSILIQQLLEDNFEKIIEYFGIDLEKSCQQIDFVKICDQLNTPKFLTHIEVPIYPVNLYKLFLKFSEKLKKEKKMKNLSKIWCAEELDQLRELVNRFGFGNWKQISIFLPGKNPFECRRIFQKQNQVKIWGFHDDIKLILGVVAFNYRWNEISNILFNFTKLETQCRERFANILDPQISQKKFSREEMLKLLFYRSQKKGWAWISKNKLPKRTDNRLLRKYRYIKRTNPKLVAEIKAIVTSMASIQTEEPKPFFKVKR